MTSAGARWEEINRIVDGGDTVVENFGWPCYEGAGTPERISAIPASARTALPANAVTAPYYAYNHSAQVVSGEACPTGSSSIVGLAFYPKRRVVPGHLQRRAVLRGLLAQLHLGDARGVNGLPIQPTASPSGPVAAGPSIWCRVPAATSSIPASTTTVCTACPTSRQSPADGRGPGERDLGRGAAHGQLQRPDRATPKGRALTYAWDLDGDGAFDDRRRSTPVVHLRRGRNGDGPLAGDRQPGPLRCGRWSLSVNNTAPTAIDRHAQSSFTWKVGDPIGFSGGATNQQDGSLPASALSWSIVMHHCPSNCHTHDIQQFARRRQRNVRRARP